MKEIISRPILFISLAAVLVVSGCSQQPDASQPAPPTSSANTATPSKNSPPQQSTSAKGASIKATPNPVQVCDGSGLGITTISYTFLPPVTAVDVRVGSPASVSQFAQATHDGSSTTGKWVSDGAVFYLQDITDGKPLTPENTLATVTVHLTKDGCK